MNAWFEEIERASSEADLVASARDYCCLLHPRELEALPPDCREIHIDTGPDIPRLRERVRQGYDGVRASEGDGRRIRDLLDYLSRASDRLGALRSPQ